MPLQGLHSAVPISPSHLLAQVIEKNCNPTARDIVTEESWEKTRNVKR